MRTTGWLRPFWSLIFLISEVICILFYSHTFVFDSSINPIWSVSLPFPLFLLNSLPIQSLVTRQLLDSNGSVGMRQRIHRDVFLLIGGTIDGKYQPHPAYFDHVSASPLPPPSFISSPSQVSFSWKELQMMQLPAPFVYHAVIVLNGIVYVFGGGDTQEAYSKKM